MAAPVGQMNPAAVVPVDPGPESVMMVGDGTPVIIGHGGNGVAGSEGDQVKVAPVSPSVQLSGCDKFIGQLAPLMLKA